MASPTSTSSFPSSPNMRNKTPETNSEEEDGKQNNVSGSTVETIPIPISVSINDKGNEEKGKRRDFNRRKSDPVSLKKILEDSEDEIVPKFDDSFDSEEEEEEEEGSTFREKRRTRTRPRPRSLSLSLSSNPFAGGQQGHKGQEMFHLRWKNHQFHLIQEFESLLESEAFCDITLICDDDEDDDEIVRMKAHKIVLSACSEYFCKILGENPCKHPILVLKGYKAWEVQALLDFMYRGEVDVKVDRVKELVKSAESLQIRGLTESLGPCPCPCPAEEQRIKAINNNNNNKIGTIPNKLIKLNIPGLEVLNLPSTRKIQGLEILRNGREYDHNEDSDVDGRKQSQSQNQLIMPRRKQARPRRRSGDYIAQDLSMTSTSKSPNDVPDEDEYEDDLEDEEDEDNLPIMNNLNTLLTRRLLSGGHHEQESKEHEMNPNLRRTSSRLNLTYPHDDPFLPKRARNDKEEDQDSDEVIDYSGGGVKISKEGRDKKGMNQDDALQQQHLAFLRNYNNWAMGQQSGKGIKSPDKLSDEQRLDLSSPRLDRTPPPYQHSKGPRNTPTSLPFPRGDSQLPFPFLPGLGHPLGPPPLNGNNNHSNIKMSPSSPSFFSGVGEGESTSSTSPHVFPPLEKGEGESSKGKSHSHGASRGSPVQHQHQHQHPWPGLPLGPPPIFGRHRAQHSAPRGGPPRAWSNADLTEALHNVWNKKMTTSQASRIFGIPYNSLLMYVRGKYGKSLKLDLLKKGLDQAMENNQNSNTKANQSSRKSNSPNSSNSNSRNSNPSPNQNQNQNPTIATTPNPASVTALLNSLNNNTVKSHHIQDQVGFNVKNSKQNGLEMPLQDHLPPGFNPFLFGDFGQSGHGGNPFPFASALQHILPPHLAGVGVGVGHPGGPFGPLGSVSGVLGGMKKEKVGGVEDK